MKRLVVGLGNFGEEFEGTRHNAGFLIVEELAGVLGGGSISSSWESNYELGVETCSLRMVNNLLLFAKPRTLVNSSGGVVRKLVKQLKVDLGDFLLIHDDLDLPPGEFKLQKGRGAAGHKGVESVIDALGSREFWRLRVGIGKPSEGVAVEDYVLGKFGPDELGALEKVIKEELAGAVGDWVGK